MLSESEIDKNAAQLADYNASSELPDILSKYAALLKEYQDLRSDYEEVRDGREMYKRMAKNQINNPFVAVLIDGDGYIFNDSLLSLGPAGGANAAKLLYDKISLSMQRKGFENCQVVIHIYANIAGVSKALSKEKLTGPEKRSLAPFIASFNRSYGLVNFIDAGELKENADFKLRAMLRHYAENGQCHHIYFGGCHDVGYISDLTPYRNAPAKLTLIHSTSIHFHEEFRKLGVEIEELPGVFRSLPLGGAFSSPSFDTKPTSGGSLVVRKQPISLEPQKSVCSFNLQGKCKFGSACKLLHNSNQSSSSKWNANSDARSNVKPIERNMLSKLPSKEEILHGYIAINKDNFRLDPYIEPSTQEMITRLKAYQADRRFCNSFHLGKYCKNGDACIYNHEPLDKELIQPLEFLARSIPCSSGSNCRLPNCTSGHICQLVNCSRRGGKAYCKLPLKLHTDEFAVTKYVAAEFETTLGGQARHSISSSPDDTIGDQNEEETGVDNHTASNSLRSSIADTDSS